MAGKRSTGVAQVATVPRQPPSSLKFFAALRWLDGRPLLETIPRASVDRSTESRWLARADGNWATEKRLWPSALAVISDLQLAVVDRCDSSTNS